ncbi:MAG: YqaJ viral recombinase family protein [Firmicutes bacterium]|nr:YqaJ viral recombinase family protein [Bacillota bacterium]
MATVLTSTKGLDRAAWLQARRHGLGGSDIAAILGLNPWRSPLDVWAEKVSEEPSATEPPSEAAYWGQLLEDVVAKEFARRTGLKVQRRQAILQHPTIPYLLANVDRIVRGDPDGPALLEVKTTGARHAGDWANDQVPAYYFPQVQHYLLVTGYRKAYVACLIGGQELVIRTVPFLADWAKQIEEAAAAFWLCVETRTPPVIDGSVAAAKALTLQFPHSNGQAVDLPAEAAQWAAEWLAAKQARKQAEARMTAAENRLKAILGEAAEGRVAGYRVLWPERDRRTLDTKALKAQYPDLAAQFEQVQTYRTFDVKEA